MPRAKAPAPPRLRDRILDLRRLPASALQDHQHNWRVHPQAQRDALQGVLHELGIASALLVYESVRQGGLCVIDGHLRKSLDPAQEWPCLLLDLDDDEASYLLATHDPLGAMAEASREALAQVLQDVTSGQAAVQELLAQLAEQHGVVPPEPQGPLVDVEPEIDRAEELRQQYGIEVGQLWACGVHRILCADSLEPANLTRVLGTEIPRMIVADPPYGVNIVATNESVGGVEAYDIPFGGVKNPRSRGHVGGGESYKAKHGEYAIQRDKRRGTVGAAKPFGSQKVRGSVGASHVVDAGKYAPVLGDDSPKTAITAVTLLLDTYPSAVHVWWGGNYYADALPPSSCWLVWDKETTGNFADCELAWTNQQKAARLFHHRWNGMLRDSERERRWHPTQKPAALFAWAYETLGQEDDVVLDPFLGSGPSLIAAEQRGRRLCGVELSPDYVAVAMDRWSQVSGHTPTLIEG
jgi:site-specific DNA-methyltransferase (adenine-specific)/modification methylase